MPEAMADGGIIFGLRRDFVDALEIGARGREALEYGCAILELA